MTIWEVVPFADVIHVYQPETLTKKQLDPTGSYPVFGANGQIGSHSEYNHENCELLLGCRGSVGSVNWSRPKSWINGNAMVVRPKDDRLTISFVELLLTGGLDLSDSITGAAQPQITRSSLSTLSVPIPPLQEQERIVQLLDGFTQAQLRCVGSVQDAADALTDLDRSVPDALFEGLDAPRAPLSSLCEVFDDGDWVESKDQSSEGIRLVQTGNVGIGVFKDRREKARWISPSTFDDLRCTEVLPGDVLISRLPDPVGRACVVPETGDRMITAVDCTIARLKESTVLSEFLVLYSRTGEYGAQVREKITGATRDRISRSNLGAVLIPCPELSLQKDLIERARSCDIRIVELKSLCEERLTRLGELRRSILNTALSGEF